MRIGTLMLQELKILLRDKQALGLLFLMPLGLIIFLTMAMENVYRAKIGKDQRLTIVTENCDSGLCADLVKELQRLSYGVDFSKGPPFDKKTTIALVLPKKIESTVEALKESRPLKDEDRITLLFDPLVDQSVRALGQAQLVIALQNLLVEQAQHELADAAKGDESAGGSAIQVPNATRVEGLGY